MTAGSFWGGFEQDPRDPRNSGLRASDRDRNQVIEALGTAYAEGRLSRDEYDERSRDVGAARTLGELPALVGDLIPSTPARLSEVELHAEAVRRYREERRESFSYLVPALICWVIWAANGMGFPWPVFVTIGTALPTINMWVNPKGHIESKQRSLERKQER
ncbi:MAG TPA: DUF1707 domain-containing protein, partial [Marmoricola sp.]